MFQYGYGSRSLLSAANTRLDQGAHACKPDRETGHDGHWNGNGSGPDKRRIDAS